MFKFVLYASFAICLGCLVQAQDQQQQDQQAQQGENEPVVRANIDPYKFLRAVQLARPGNPFLLTPATDVRNLKWVRPENPIETNEVDTGDDASRRTLLVFRRFEEPRDILQPPQESPSGSGIEIRKKRDAGLLSLDQSDSADLAPETTLISKIRNKRTHCKKCRKYGGGVVYVPVAVQPVAVQPVALYGGGGGHGCHKCGGGGYGGYPSYPSYPSYGGFGGGGGGSFSFSSSSSHSGSFGFGK